ncbi:hypothetical protein FB45DRAFT_753492 [Roridomyces roridus]|uniref:LysM domain-containing protein n=1 Tax=Roridomyces roridus TaxID=1738132 RepID=A0AAD7BI89_9AGAR|nr:hypothetical protein FB45DRAFT_753492 [Roridomyces roridus]
MFPANGRYDEQIKNLINNNCATTTPPSSCAQTYTVVSGDTCSKIESKNGISDATLHSLNPSINTGCTNLAIGQVLCVQAGSSGGTGTCTQTYTVVSGDTCSKIESNEGISDAQLHALNPSINTGCTSTFPVHQATRTNQSYSPISTQIYPSVKNCASRKARAEAGHARRCTRS